MAAAGQHGRPAVASLWIGGALRWTDRLSLASFVHRGHAVTLFHSGPCPAVVPEGVETRAADTVFDPGPLAGLSPALVSDLFRLHLQRQTGMIWVDTDVLCWRPLELQPGGWLIGREEGAWINGAVLRMPAGSAALAELLAGFADPGFVPDWLPAAHLPEVMAAPGSDRLATACRLVPNLLGPRALTHVLARHGEDRHALPARVLNPLPWSMGDAWFNPHGGVTGWFGPDTMTAHLYASRLRSLHLRARPRKDSFIAGFAEEIGFSFAGA